MHYGRVLLYGFIGLVVILLSLAFFGENAPAVIFTIFGIVIVYWLLRIGWMIIQIASRKDKGEEE